VGPARLVEEQPVLDRDGIRGAVEGEAVDEEPDLPDAPRGDHSLYPGGSDRSADRDGELPIDVGLEDAPRELRELDLAPRVEVGSAIVDPRDPAEQGAVEIDGADEPVLADAPA